MESNPLSKADIEKIVIEEGIKHLSQAEARKWAKVHQNTVRFYDVMDVER